MVHVTTFLLASLVGAGPGYSGDVTETFDVTSYGAVGDNATVATGAVRKAVAACQASTANSKRLVFPRQPPPTDPTIYVVGPVDLSCNDTVVEVAEGVVLHSVGTTAQWPLGPDCPEPSQGLTPHQAAPFAMVRDTVNLTLTGGGTLDANGPMWWDDACGNWWCPKWMPNATPADPYAFRPFMLRIMGSHGVTVSGLTFRDCGFWCIVPTHSQFVTITNCTVDTNGKGPNTDGVEPMWSTSVEITDMNIHNGDDCITVKSGSRDVHVERVRCQSSHGLAIGSVWYDDVVNVTYRNCTLVDCANGPRIKGRRQGNATVSDILFDNILIESAGNGIQVDMDYETPGSHPTNSGVTARNVSFMNVRGTAKSTPGQLACLDTRPCDGVTLDAVDLVEGAPRDYTFDWKCSGLASPQWSNVKPPPSAQCVNQSVSDKPQL